MNYYEYNKTNIEEEIKIEERVDDINKFLDKVIAVLTIFAMIAFIVFKERVWSLNLVHRQK